jgi:hypothetical protein
VTDFFITFIYFSHLTPHTSHHHHHHHTISIVDKKYKHRSWCNSISLSFLSILKNRQARLFPYTSYFSSFFSLSSSFMADRTYQSRRFMRAKCSLLWFLVIVWVPGGTQRVESFHPWSFTRNLRRDGPRFTILSESKLGGSEESNIESETNASESRSAKSLHDLLLPSNTCKVDQMRGTDLGELFYLLLPFPFIVPPLLD